MNLSDHATSPVIDFRLGQRPIAPRPLDLPRLLADSAAR